MKAVNSLLETAGELQQASTLNVQRRVLNAVLTNMWDGPLYL